MVTDGDLRNLKVLLDKIWAKLKIGVAFTTHFLDRVNEARNGRQITICELASLFVAAFKKFGDKLAHIPQHEWEAVLTDSQTDVNVPFVLKHNGQDVTIVAKTVMRKHNFFTADPKLAVAQYEPKGEIMDEVVSSSTEALPTSEKNWPYHRVLHKHGFHHNGSNHPDYNEYRHEHHTYLRDKGGKNHIGVNITHGKNATSVAVQANKKKTVFIHSPEELDNHLKSQNESTERKQMGKTFQQLQEWVGLNVPDTETGMSVQAVDDVDTGAMYADDADVLDKLNFFLHSICNKQYINPYYVLNTAWKKLSVVGLHFDMRSIIFTGVEGRVTVPVTQYGGRYGALGDPSSFISKDDGTRIPGGLNLVVTFQKNASVYTVDLRLERGVETAPFVEASFAKPVKEAKTYSLSPAQSFSHTPANPDRTAHNRTTNTYKEFPHSDAMHKFLSGSNNHADTWKAWHDTPAGYRHKTSKLAADRQVGATDPVTEAMSSVKPFHDVLNGAGYKHTGKHANHDVFTHPSKPKVGVLYGKTIGTSALTTGHILDTPEALKKHLGADDLKKK